MQSEKGDHSVTVISQPPLYSHTPDMTSPGSRRVSRKCLIASITTGVVIVLVAIVTLIGIKLYLDSKVQINQMRLQLGGATVDEQHTIGQSSHVVEYHIVDGSGLEMWIILDASKGLKITRLQSGATDVCTVTPLALLTSLPTGNGVPLAALTNSTNSTSNSSGVQMGLASQPIQDTSVLGYDGQKLCQGVNAYWSYPLCTSQSSTNGGSPSAGAGRRRRATCHYNWCHLSYTNCYWMTFAASTNSGGNDPFMYYSCDMTCQMMSYNC